MSVTDVWALRYDKLYIGNDVFFVNDRTRRAERLHQHIDPGAGTSFSNSSLAGSFILNDSQVSNAHARRFSIFL